MARANVTDEQWKEFRRACLDDGVPVSDALGRLVEAELRKKRLALSASNPRRRSPNRSDEPRLFE